MQKIIKEYIQKYMEIAHVDEQAYLFELATY